MDNNTQITEKQSQAMRYIRNCIVHSGKSPSVRDVMKALGYKSSYSALLVIDSLIELGYLKKREDKSIQLIKDIKENKHHAQTVNVPLVGTVACGSPILAEENIEGYVPVSTRIAKPGNKYFFLRAEGDSMNNAGIDDGDLLLIKQQFTADENDKVVALIDDGATVKKFYRTDDMVVLKPSSTNKDHQPIFLTNDFQIQGVVIKVIKDI